MKKLINLILILFIVSAVSEIQAQVLISNGTGETPDPSAMLEVKSTTKGLLIPRMSTTDRESISNATSGLLVFDTVMNSFFIYGQGKWNDLSTPSGIWETNSSNVYLSGSYTNVGIGTNSPGSKFVVQADAGANENAVLFEVKDEYDVPIFQVTSAGVRVFVRDETETKAVSGGFAVGRYGAAKGLPDTTYFSVTPYQTEVNTKTPPDKAVSGGFAVGRYGAAKGVSTPIFTTSPQETRIYTTDESGGKAVSGGFAVGRYGAAKGPFDNYMHITRENYFIGDSAGANTTPGLGEDGKYNVFIGFKSGYGNITGNQNTFIGHASGVNNDLGHHNVFIGNNSGQSNTDGQDNVFIGPNAGFASDTGSGNVYLGDRAGRNFAGDNNVIIGNLAGGVETTSTDGSGNIFVGYQAGLNERGSNKLYITNNGLGADSALIFGDLDPATKKVHLNGTFRFNRGDNTITMPTTRGSGPDLTLTIDPSTGGTSWVDAQSLITIPPIPDAYVPPIVVVTLDPTFTIKSDDNIGTLIVKTEKDPMITTLPPVEANINRIIKVQNLRADDIVQVYASGEDVIDGVIEQPLTVYIGETYTFQAGIDKETGQRTWFIVDYTSTALDEISSLLKETDITYDFAKDPDGPRVATLIIINQEGGLSIFLPLAKDFPNRKIVIKNSGGDKAHTIRPADTSGDLIDGRLDFTLPIINYESYTLQSDGVKNWYIVNKF